MLCLRSWARSRSRKDGSDHGKNKGNTNGDLRPGPPRLPDERQYHLTPSPSNDDISFLQSSECMFFERLPLELRQQIYRAAFGDRTLHMDLTYNAFLPNLILKDHVHAMTATRRWKMSHANSGWLWWGSVCHRHPRVHPSQDYCHDPRKDYFTTCGMGPGSVPDKCYIGVMGWLLACRQAYAEGIEVLYNHNTICITSVLLMLRIDSLFLPQRLQSIVSLEIIWSDWLAAPSRPGAVTGQMSKERSATLAFRRKTWTNLDTFLNKLPLLFPALRQLYFTIAAGRETIDKTAYSWEAYAMRIFDSIDPIVVSLCSSLQECYLAIPRILYEPASFAVLKGGSSAQVHRGGILHPLRGFWKDVADEGVGETTEKLGYWVVHGELEPRWGVGSEVDLTHFHYV